MANYLQPWSKLLQDNGYTPGEAISAARIVLPDILRYDLAQRAAYPNGRAIADDAFSARFAWLTNGKVPPDASSRTMTCWPGSPTSARPISTQPGNGRDPGGRPDLVIRGCG